MHGATEQRLDTPGLQLAAQRWGVRGGHPTLALHGWLDNAASFAALAPCLPQLDLVALDLPGHGRSGHRARGQPYHFVDWISTVFDAADALGWNNFALLGHSMGAGIASLAAGVYAERITHLVLVEGLGPNVSVDAEAPDNLVSYLRQRARPRPSPHYASLEEATKRLLGARPQLTPALARLLAVRGTQSDTRGVAWRSDPALRWPSPHRFNENEVLAFLRRIRAPTLLFVAEHGAHYHQESMRLRAASVGRLCLVKVPGSHDVHMTHPERLAPVISDFFADLGPP